MWGWSFLLLAGMFLWLARQQGLRYALGATVLLALLVPAWAVMGYQVRNLGFQPLGIPIDMRVAVGFLGALACCMKPKTVLPTRLVVADLLLLCLMAIHVLSDWKNEGLSYVIVLRAIGEWAVPYLVGRIAIRHIEDVKRLLPYASWVVVVLSLLAIWESVVRVNLPELMFDERPVDNMSRMMLRWGFKRAYCVANHPIFFGGLLLLLCPWAFYAMARASRRSQTRGLVIGVVACAGVVATLSRGPMLALAILIYVALVLFYPRWRKMLVGVAALGALVVMLQFETVLDTLHLWSGESQRKRVQTVNIDGRQFEHSGTLTRIYLLEVYGEAIRRAGLLGFGTERVTNFPVRVPVGPELADTLKKVPWIDNVYVLMILRFGYLGVLAFVALGAASVVGFSLESLTGESGRFFYACMAGAVLATLVLMLTVWMPRDFGFVYLWSVGASAGVRAQRLLNSEYGLGIAARR